MLINNYNDVYTNKTEMIFKMNEWGVTKWPFKINLYQMLRIDFLVHSRSKIIEIVWFFCIFLLKKIKKLNGMKKLISVKNPVTLQVTL